MESQRLNLTHSIGLLILRLGIGGYMLTHGWDKVQMVIDGQAEMFGDPIGLGNGLSVALMIMAEFGCALLVMAGLATRLAAAPIAFAMAIAAFVAHGNDPWTMGEAAAQFFAGNLPFPQSKQPALMFLVVFLALMFPGPGRFSLDALIWPRLRRGRARSKAIATAD